MKLLREPLVHFLLLGAMLFGVFALVGDRGSARTGQIVVTPGHIEHLTSASRVPGSARPRHQSWPDCSTTTSARRCCTARPWPWAWTATTPLSAAACGKSWSSSPRRLPRWPRPPMRISRPSLQQHPDAFRVEPRLAFQHVYLSRDRRGDAADAEARQLLAQLTTGDAATDTAALGDPFLLPPEFALSSRSEIARLFGDAFAHSCSTSSRGAGRAPSSRVRAAPRVRPRAYGRPGARTGRGAAGRATRVARGPPESSERAVLPAPARPLYGGRGAATGGWRQRTNWRGGRTVSEAR